MGGAAVELSLPYALPRLFELSGPGSFLRIGLRMVPENAGLFQVPASSIVTIIVIPFLYRKPLLTTPGPLPEAAPGIKLHSSIKSISNLPRRTQTRCEPSFDEGSAMGTFFYPHLCSISLIVP